MRKIWKNLKNYPEFLGIGAICILVIIILVYKLELRQRYVEPGIVTENMARENTVEGFTATEDAVRYMISALQKDDLDMGLRGFPIDEKILGINVGEQLDSLGEFSTNITYMPSQWREFVPVSSSEITRDYTEIFDSMKKHFAGKTIEVEQVSPIFPEKQLETQYHRNSQKICEIWGANSQVEIVVKLKIDGEDYAAGMTLLRYGKFWKVDSFTSSLAEEQEKEGIWSCNDQEYDQLTDKSKEEELTELLDDTEEKENQNEQEQEKVVPEDELLPANYMLYNSVFGENPEETIENFVLCIQKNDLAGMMVYTDIYGEEDPFEQELSEMLIKQGELAEQIQTFYYYLMGSDFATTETTSLDELGMTGGEISNSFELNEIVYLDLNNVLKISDNEYAAFYYFNGKRYMSGFTMKEYGSGWKIENLSCPSMEIENGQVEELTEKEYNVILEEYR